MRLTSDEREAYNAQGFVVRERAFDAAELDVLRRAVELAATAAAQLAEEGDTYILDGNRFVDHGFTTIQFEHQPGSDVVRVVEPVHHLHPQLDALIDDARLAEPMRCLVGDEQLALWTNKLNLKRPAGGSGFGWHQDSPYWIHDSDHVDRLPNVMLLLDDADEGNGCLRMVAGSHLEGGLPGTDDGTQLGGFYTAPEAIDAARVVPVVAPAGSLIFFSPHVVHGSGPNRSERPRRALIYTYQPGGFPALKSGALRAVEA